MEYLGVIISKGSIHMDPIKIKGIMEWPILTKKKELQIIPWFYQLLLPLHKKLQQNCEANDSFDRERAVEWGMAQQKHL